LFSSCISCWEYDFFLEFALEYAPFDVMAIVVVVVTNHPSNGLPLNLKLKWDQLAH
jgi:hypothetical protein